MPMESVKKCRTFLIDCDAFITNNSTKTREQFLAKLNDLGFEAQIDECFCAAFATARYLKSINFSKEIYVIGSIGLIEELSNHGIKTRYSSVYTEND
ncbi:hypothetical protein HZS_323 [Henneguya salminicola]|nr:hypothetical protein HZS_323 [Henneguya salminicola]